MSEYDLMYMSWIGDRIVKYPEDTTYWVSALKEHICFLQQMIEKKRAENEGSQPPIEKCI